MDGYDIAKNELSELWYANSAYHLLDKKIDVSIYGNVNNEIPDKFVYIEEVIPESEAEEVWERYGSFLNKYNVVPFLVTLGEAVICIGNSESNRGEITLFDFEFGHFRLDGNFSEFYAKLVNK